MPSAPYNALVATSSATAKSGIAHGLLNGADLVTLPVIVAAPAAGQAKPGDIVYLAAPELAGGFVEDANTGNVFDTIAPLGSAFYVASANGIWKKAGTPAVPVTQIVVPLGASRTLSIGTANVPAAIATLTPTGFMPFVLNDGSIGFIPYWQ